MCTCIYFDVNNFLTAAISFTPSTCIEISCLPLKLQLSSMFKLIIQMVANILC